MIVIVSCKPSYQFSWNYFKFKLYFPPVLHPGLSGYRNNGHITHFEKKNSCFQLRAHITYFEKIQSCTHKIAGRISRPCCQNTDFEQKIKPKSPKNKFFGPRSNNLRYRYENKWAVFSRILPILRYPY